MVAIGQTVTIVNKSGKVVKTSKHLANVFKEAKSAYLEKKAELTSKRDDGLSQKAASTTNGSDSGRTTYERGPPLPSRQGSESVHTTYERGPPRPTRHGSESGHTTYERGPSRKHPHTASSQSSRQSSRRSSRDYDSHSSRRREHSDNNHNRPSPERGYSDSFYANDKPSSKSITRTSTAPLTASNLRHATTPTTTPTTPTFNQSRTSSRLSLERSELLRRRSDTDFTSSDRTLRPSHSHSSLDSDLAYGDDHILAVAPPGAISTEDELRTKMSGLQRLLQEAECAQYSAKAVIASLEKNPDAMAAVALTLAEISNLATKMAPGALMALKGSFPVIIGLLLSPEFLIAGGVALGVTVVSFGGYKIVKRLKMKKAKKLEEGKKGAGNGEESEEEEELELEDITQLDRIDQWRRGIYLPPGADEASVGTSVEGEFVTPKAGKMLREDGILAEKPKTKKEKPKEKSSKKPTEKDLAKQMKEVEKQKKDLEKREKELAKQKDDVLKASERNEKAERKATAAESKKAEKREKAEKAEKAEKGGKQKQIMEHGEDGNASETGSVAPAETAKEKADVQSLLKTIFRKTAEKEKGEVIA